MTAWPDAVRGLPVCPVRGLPIPASSERDPATGAGRFGINDSLAKLACGLSRTCGVCGLALGTTIIFLAVDHGANPAMLVFSDPGMHQPCADASMLLCPFIQHERMPHRTGARPAKPGWLWVASPSYQLVPGRGSAFVAFRPGPVQAIRRFHYAHGRLVGHVFDAGERREAKRMEADGCRVGAWPGPVRPGVAGQPDPDPPGRP